MYNRDYRDIIGGTLISTIGMVATYIAFTDMNIGSLARIGPGMFPGAIGILLVMLGVAILLPALSRSGDRVNLAFRPLLAISAGMLVFCFTIRSLGIIPSVALTTLVASQADKSSSPLVIAASATSLSLLATAIFKFGFGVSTPIIALPW